MLAKDSGIRKTTGMHKDDHLSRARLLCTHREELLEVQDSLVSRYSTIGYIPMGERDASRRYLVSSSLRWRDLLI